MGPSGSGKSTLLTIAGTLEEPTCGEVLVGGVDVTDHVAATTRPGCGAASIGYVFQDFNLLAGLTALENVTLPLELDGVGGRGRPGGGARGARPLRPGRQGVPLPRRPLRR